MSTGSHAIGGRANARFARDPTYTSREGKPQTEVTNTVDLQLERHRATTPQGHSGTPSAVDGLPCPRCVRNSASSLSSAAWRYPSGIATAEDRTSVTPGVARQLTLTKEVPAERDRGTPRAREAVQTPPRATEPTPARRPSCQRCPPAALAAGHRSDCRARRLLQVAEAAEAMGAGVPVADAPAIGSPSSGLRFPSVNAQRPPVLLASPVAVCVATRTLPPARGCAAHGRVCRRLVHGGRGSSRRSRRRAREASASRPAT
jgi:hypothetical protein